jgi:hypothetical protein
MAQSVVRSLDPAVVGGTLREGRRTRSRRILDVRELLAVSIVSYRQRNHCGLESVGEPA